MMSSPTPPTPTCGTTITPAARLAANLRALSRTSASAARAIGHAAARTDLIWGDSAETDQLGEPARFACIPEWGPLGEGFGDPIARPLCSRRRPLAEAEAIASKVDVSAAAAVVILGFGVGHHVAALARRMETSGVVIVYEPDLGLLRAVMERVDCTGWMGVSNVILLIDGQDQASIAQATAGIEHIVALGVTTVSHPPSRERLAAGSDQFLANLTGTIKAIRTTVVTTLVQSRATVRNVTQNVDHYALGAGLAPLAGRLRRRTAIVVSAGPSLSRNIELLKDAKVRERCCIIAAQTVLRTLLREGIKPHFVTALDFHEISARFYEGLTAEEVRGITLVVEPKVNPAVTSAFPAAKPGLAMAGGLIRCSSDEFLDELLGPELHRPMGRIEPGATVAHLSYYLARYLGCTRVVLVGQDLGFTDGRYYASGAAIHDTWGPELGEYDTLEMHEWQRIVRARSLLRKVPDIHGGTIYTDEQMATYLVQFQRDFKRDAEAGLITIDATEGGCLKAFAPPMTLGKALESVYGEEPADAPSIDQLLAEAGSTGAEAWTPEEVAKRKQRVEARISAVRRDVRTIEAQSYKATALLERMLSVQNDQRLVGGLIEQVYAIRDKVTALQPAYRLVERLNQNGAFRRTRADRRIHHTKHGHVGQAQSGDGQTGQPQVGHAQIGGKQPSAFDAELAEQAARIERDIANTKSIAESAGELAGLLDAALASLSGAPKLTRDPTAEPLPAGPASSVLGSAGHTVDSRVSRTAGVVVARRLGSPLGDGRALEASFTSESTVLGATVARVLRCRGLRGVTVLTDDAAWASGLLGPAQRERVTVMQARGPLYHLEPEVVAACRATAPASWRGGVGGLLLADECFAPQAIIDACEAAGADAALLVDGSWCMVDPKLCHALVERYEEDPESHRITFNQAGCGLSGLVIDAKLAAQLRDTAATAGLHATLGGLLSYVPIAPMADPIAKSMCVPVPPVVRDLVGRAVIDEPEQAALWAGVLVEAGLDPLTASAAEIAQAANLRAETWMLPDAPEIIRCDGLEADAVVSAIAGARKRSARVHLRTSLFGGVPEAHALAGLAKEHGIEVISVDVHGTDERTFEAVTGLTGSAYMASREGFAYLRNTLGVGVATPAVAGGEPGSDGAAGAVGAANALQPRATYKVSLPLLVPRLRKCDATVNHVEAFYDEAVMLCSWAVIDGPPEVASGPERGRNGGSGHQQRVQPLALPKLAVAREQLLAAKRVQSGGSAGSSVKTPALSEALV